MAKRFNDKIFHIELPNNKTVTLYCWSTPSRYYACVRHCWCPECELETRETVYNRTWECFDYEGIIQQLCRKMRKNSRSGLALIVEKWCEAEEKRASAQANAFVAAFKAAYNGLTDEQKTDLASRDILLENEKQATAMLEGLQIISTLNKIL